MKVTRKDIDDALIIAIQAEHCAVEARQVYRETVREYQRTTFDIKEGDRVRDRRGRIGIVFDIHGLIEKPFLCVNLVKKDGATGQRIAEFYNWEKCE